MSKFTINYDYPLLDRKKINNFDVYFPPTEYWIKKGKEKKLDIKKLLRMANIKKIDSVYFHFPFCPSRCRICPYIKLENKYLNIVPSHIIEEIKIFRKVIKKKIISNSLMFGGGTPNFMPLKFFEELLKELKRTFDLTKAKQIIIEIRPGIKYKEHILLLLKNFTPKQIHVSIGAQSMKEEGIKFYKQPVKGDPLILYTLEDVEEIIDFCHKKGIKDINLDFMLRNLKEFMEEEKEIERLVKEKKITKLTIYPVFYKFMERKNFIRPTFWNFEEIVNLRKEIYKFMRKIGFVVGIWPNYFVKKGYIANYESITQFKGTTLIAFGPSGRSVVDSKKIRFYYENAKQADSYINKIKKGLLSADSIYVYPKHLNRNLAKKILNLFIMKKIPYSYYKEILRLGKKSGYKKEIEKLFNLYFRRDRKGYFFFNQKGFYVAEVVVWALWDFIKKAFEKCN